MQPKSNVYAQVEEQYGPLMHKVA